MDGANWHYLPLATSTRPRAHRVFAAILPAPWPPVKCHRHMDLLDSRGLASRGLAPASYARDPVDGRRTPIAGLTLPAVAARHGHVTRRSRVPLTTPSLVVGPDSRHIDEDDWGVLDCW